MDSQLSLLADSSTNNQSLNSESVRVQPEGGLSPEKGASAPLGIYAGKAPTKGQANRAAAYALQGFARDLICEKNRRQKTPFVHPDKYYRTASCSLVPHGSAVGVNKSIKHNKAFYSGLKICGKIWICPVCARKIAERRRQEVAQAIDWAYSKGKKAVMVTFTIPHYRGDKLENLVNNMAAAMRDLRKGNKSMQLFKSRMGFDGFIKATEITHGGNGWHPHYHELWFVDQDAPASEIHKFLLNRWKNECRKRGMIPKGKTRAFNARAVDVRDNASCSEYLSKLDDQTGWGADRELSSAASKKGKAKGRTPFQLLDDAANGDKAAYAAWSELLEFLRGRPRGLQAMLWSNGLKSRVGIDEKSDEEIAEEKKDRAVLLATISREIWKVIIRLKLRAEVLTIAENENIAGLSRWIDALPKPPD